MRVTNYTYMHVGIVSYTRGIGMLNNLVNSTKSEFEILFMRRKLFSCWKKALTFNKAKSDLTNQIFLAQPASDAACSNRQYCNKG